MKLYHNPLSPNCRRVQAVAAHVGISLDEELVDLMSGAHKEPAYLKLNPNGKVPTLVDGELVLWESSAIMPYIAGKADSDLWPKSNLRYDIMRWMFWSEAHWQPAVSKLIGEYIFKPMRGGEPDQAVIDAGNKDVERYAAVLNGQLEGKKFLVNEQLSVADFAVVEMLSYREVCKLPLDHYKHLGAWAERVTGLDAWKSTHQK